MKFSRVLEDSGDEEVSKINVRKGAKSIDKRQKEFVGKTPQEEVNFLID